MVKQKNKVSEYRYIVGVLLASVLGSIILGVVIVQPLYASLKKTNQELDVKKAVLEKLETNLETLKGLESKKAEIEEKNSKVLAALPADKDVPRLFTQFENIANAAGLNISSISENGGTTGTTEATTAANPSGINTLSYQVTGTTASYSALKQALAKIEDGLRIVSIDKVDVQSNQGSSLNVTLTVTTYSRGQ